MSSSKVSCIDMSNEKLKKLQKCIQNNPAKIFTLILDNNQLTRLDNVDYYTELKELSAKHNSLTRMLYIGKLHHLVSLDLSHNRLVCMENLKDLRNLRKLILSHNNIKTIEHLHTNIHLEILDLSHNDISAISNLSPLTRLKTLNLGSNKLTHLRHCNLYLPPNLINLSLDNNNIVDLCEISHLVHLVNMVQICISNNPCLKHEQYKFEYRPYIVNWCTNVKVIDGLEITKMECLKAEWLYSQGRGRKFHVGEHDQLVQYLSKQNSPQMNGTVHIEEEKKLRLVLNKAELHKKQLIMQQSFDRDAEIMTRSLDPYILQGSSHHVRPEVPNDLALLSRSIACPSSAPLPAATTLLPVPESLNSPQVTNLPSLPSSASTSKLSINQEEDLSSSSCSLKLKSLHRTIQNKRELILRRGSNPSESNSEERRDSNSEERRDSISEERRDSIKSEDCSKENEIKAALCIQKHWRGYKARNLDKHVSDVCQSIQTQRINKYVHQLLTDMAATREALACEHQLQVLQLQAINALWNKMITQDPCNTQRCSCLSNTIQFELSSLKNVCEELKVQVAEIKNMNSSPSRSASTAINATAQTDIVAVQTPVGEAPCLWRRPCTLSFPRSNEELRTTVINDIIDDS